jgi:hypothetical protein
MSFKVLEYIASKGGAVKQKTIDSSRAREEWDKDRHYMTTRPLDDITEELRREELANYSFSTEKIELTEKGKKVAKILLEEKTV